MNGPPLVSICIPNYNNAAYIEEAIFSALNQTYENIEVIVVDNCSTDNSWHIISSIKHPRLRCIRNTKNIGMYPNFMKASKHANGIYIKFLCADDWLELNFIEQSLQFFDTKDVGLVSSTQGKYSNERKKIIGYRKIPNSKTHVANPTQLFHYFLKYTNPIGNPTRVILRKEIFDEFNGFDLTISYCNDYDLWIRIAKKYKVAFVNKVLSFERKHQQQFTKLYNSTGDDIWNVVSVWENNFSPLDYPQLSKLLSKALFTFYYTGFELNFKYNKKDYFHIATQAFQRLGMNKSIKAKLIFKAYSRYYFLFIKSFLANIKIRVEALLYIPRSPEVKS